MSASAFALVFAVLVGHALAQSLAHFPVCAQGPVLQGVAASGCAATDQNCICARDSVLRDIATAIGSKCDDADTVLALGLASELCPDSTFASSVSQGNVPHSNTATITVPDLTTTFLVTPQPTSASTSLTATKASPSVVFTSGSNEILTDTSVLLTSTTSTTYKVTDGPSKSANYTGTLTYSTTQSSTSTGGAPATLPSPDMTRLVLTSYGLAAIGLIFAAF